MALNAADWTVTRSSGNIRWTGGGTATNVTVLELHQWLQSLADDPAYSSDDQVDISDVNPSSRSTDNIITLNTPYNIDATAAQHIYNGSITQTVSSQEEIFAGLTVVGSVQSGTQLQVVQNNAVLTSYWSTGLNADATNNILLRIMVKVKSAGATIDGQRLRVFARELSDTYAEFSLTMGLGNNVAAIFTSDDPFNQTSSGTLSGYYGSTVTNTEGYQTYDLTTTSGNEPYYTKWLTTLGENTIYETAKYVTRRGTSTTIFGMNGALYRGITHSINFTSQTGNYTQNEIISWGSGATAGTGALLAQLDSGTTGTLWFQLLTGVIPASGANTITGGTSGSTSTGTVASILAYTVPAHVTGTSTGTGIIGAFGVGHDPTKATSADSFTDLNSVTASPVNTKQITVSGLVASEDYVFVARSTGSGSTTVNTTAMTLNAALSTTVTSIVMASAIATDTPSSGTIRVIDNLGAHRKISYSSYSGSTFTITSTNFTSPNNASAGNGAYVTYLDQAATATSHSANLAYVSDRDLVVRVRDGGSTPIKPFETTAVFGTSGVTVTAIRTADT